MTASEIMGPSPNPRKALLLGRTMATSNIPDRRETVVALWAGASPTHDRGLLGVVLRQLRRRGRARTLDEQANEQRPRDLLSWEAVANEHALHNRQLDSKAGFRR